VRVLCDTHMHRKAPLLRAVAKCRLLPGRPASRSEIEACHSEELVDLVATASLEAGGGTRYFTPDTYANEHTATCAALAAGACADVAVAVYCGEARSGAAIVRSACFVTSDPVFRAFIHLQALHSSF